MAAAAEAASKLLQAASMILNISQFDLAAKLAKWYGRPTLSHTQAAVKLANRIKVHIFVLRTCLGFQ